MKETGRLFWLGGNKVQVEGKKRMAEEITGNGYKDFERHVMMGQDRYTSKTPLYKDE